MDASSETLIERATPPVREILKSTCRGCHGGCSALLHVQDGRITHIEGDPDGPLNHGRLCPIGAASLQLVHNPARLTHPLVRVGARGEGQWRRASWDEAYDHHLRERAQDLGRGTARKASPSAPAPGGTTAISCRASPT